MKTYIVGSALFVSVFVVAGSASAQAGASANAQLGVQTAASSSQAGGNVEFEWKVEEGEKGSATSSASVRAEPAEPAEPARPTKAQGAQHNETDLDFIQGNAVSVAAVEVRGWDPKQKQEFLATVKAHAQVQSGQDLENFARGVLLENEAMEEIALNFEKIVVKHRAGGRLFGFIPLSFTEEVEIDTEGDDAGRVKVKMPWFAFLLKADVSAEELETEIGMNEKWIRGNTNWSVSVRAEAISLVSNILKTKHDTAKNSIGNIR